MGPQGVLVKHLLKGQVLLRAAQLLQGVQFRVKRAELGAKFFGGEQQLPLIARLGLARAPAAHSVAGGTTPAHEALQLREQASAWIEDMRKTHGLSGQQGSLNRHRTPLGRWDAASTANRPWNLNNTFAPAPCPATPRGPEPSLRPCFEVGASPEAPLQRGLQPPQALLRAVPLPLQRQELALGLPCLARLALQRPEQGAHLVLVQPPRPPPRAAPQVSLRCRRALQKAQALAPATAQAPDRGEEILKTSPRSHTAPHVKPPTSTPRGLEPLPRIHGACTPASRCHPVQCKSQPWTGQTDVSIVF